MDDPRVWEYQMNQPDPKEIVWVLIRDPGSVGRYIVGFGPEGERQLAGCEDGAFSHACLFKRASVSAPEAQFTPGRYQRMAGNDLLDVSGAGSRHAEDHDGARGR